MLQEFRIAFIYPGFEHVAQRLENKLVSFGPLGFQRGPAEGIALSPQFWPRETVPMCFLGGVPQGYSDSFKDLAFGHVCPIPLQNLFSYLT